MKLNRGFTLIELLVVIAIIAILAAILFPVFASAREKARQTTCLSNEQQMGLAMLQYVQDFDEYFPQGQYFDGSGNPFNWQNAINPYVKSGQTSNTSAAGQQLFNGLGGIYSCPSFPAVEEAEYGAHEYLCPTVAQGVTTVPVEPLSQVGEPAIKILVVEKGQGAQGNYPVFDASEQDWVGWLNNGSATDFVLRDPAPDTDLNYDYDETLGGAAAPFAQSPAAFPRYRHSATTNVLFVDGHVKSMVKGSISGDNWVKYIWIPNVTPAADVPNSYEPNF